MVLDETYELFSWAIFAKSCRSGGGDSASISVEDKAFANRLARSARATEIHEEAFALAGQ